MSTSLPAPLPQHKLAGIIGLSCYLPLLEEKPIVSGACVLGDGACAWGEANCVGCVLCRDGACAWNEAGMSGVCVARGWGMLIWHADQSMPPLPRGLFCRATCC